MSAITGRMNPAPFLMATRLPIQFPETVKRMPGTAYCQSTAPLSRNVISAPVLEARLATLASPEAYGSESFSTAVRAMI